jgi:superoxide reductase
MVKESMGFSLEEVNWPKDVERMTDLEKKHSPRIVCPDTVKPGEMFEVKIITGKLLKHPNESGHFIMWTELYAGDRFLGRTQFAPVTTEPETCFIVSLNKSAELIAYSMCNLHGLWKNTVHIEVK